MTTRRLRVTALLGVALLGCGSDPDPVWEGDAPLRILFVGNSLTFWNSLPSMLQQMAALDGERTLEPVDLSQGGYALEDHWVDGWARDVLLEGGWDVVVLQQGPSSLPENRENLIQWSKIWADAIRQQEGIPALYMVWPDRSRIRYFDEVSESYRQAAAASDARLFAAGDAWQHAWAQDPNLPLYDTDDLHPSPMGTYLAALTIYRGLTGRDAPSLPVVGVGDAEDTILHAAAREAQADLRTAADAHALPARR